MFFFLDQRKKNVKKSSVYQQNKNSQLPFIYFFIIFYPLFFMQHYFHRNSQLICSDELSKAKFNKFNRSKNNNNKKELNMVKQKFTCPCSNVTVDLENDNGLGPVSSSCLTELLEDNVEDVNGLSALIQESFMNQNSCGISKVGEVFNQSQWVDIFIKIVSICFLFNCINFIIHLII